jgi:hypothetical protein
MNEYMTTKVLNNSVHKNTPARNVWVYKPYNEYVIL